MLRSMFAERRNIYEPFTGFGIFISAFPFVHIIFSVFFFLYFLFIILIIVFIIMSFLIFIIRKVYIFLQLVEIIGCRFFIFKFIKVIIKRKRLFNVYLTFQFFLCRFFFIIVCAVFTFCIMDVKFL